jgi:hypothetical protein
MKEILLFCFVITLNTLFSQNSLIAIEFPEYRVLYRNYPNKIFIPSENGNKIIINGENLNVLTTENLNEYIIIPQIGREATINVLVENKNGYDTLRKSTFLVKNFPTPLLYWGDSKYSDEVNINEEKIHVKFSEDVPLDVDFNIKSWILKFDSLNICGEGNNISTAKEYLMTIKKPTKISLEVIVYHPLSKESFIKIDRTWNVLPLLSDIEEK